MEPMGVEITEEGTTQQRPSVDSLPFARDYQLEALLETAIKQNTIVFLETDSGKTLIAAMLLRSYASLLRKPSPFFAVFLVPTVLLVKQQSEALMKDTDLKVEKYWGGKGANYRHPASWIKEVDQHEVLVMTPEILLAALRHSCLKIDMIKVLIFDECHSARGKHPYACIMTEFYHQEMNSKNSNLPRILGMTASPIKAKDYSSESNYWQQIHELENLMHAKIYTCPSESVLAECISSSTTKLEFYKCGDIPHAMSSANELKLLQNKPEYSLETCNLDFPRGCPIQTVGVKDNPKQLKQLDCLEAFKQLHQIGELTDNLLPDIVEEEKEAQQIDSFGEHIVEQVKYVPSELVAYASNDSRTLYHCYLIEMEPDFDYNIKPHNILLALRTRLNDNETLSFDLDVNNGSLRITLRYDRVIELNPDEVLLCQMFQLTVFRVLIDHKYEMLHGVLGESCPRGECVVFDYLLLPTTGSHQHSLIDWECVRSVEFRLGIKKHVDFSPDRCHGRLLRTSTDSVCSCMLENCLVVTPHNDKLYCISGILHQLDGNSSFASKNGRLVTYKEHFKQRHDITLKVVEQPLLQGMHVFSVKNYLRQCRSQNANEPRGASAELPPELCDVVMSPISVASFYSFCFAPSVMYRIESLLLAATLKSVLVDHCVQNDIIPTIKVLEAITTKECQENFNLESLETFGDSFLKYAVSQQLFKTNQNDHEGLLTDKREKIVSNVSLSKKGCNNKILGFIRNDPFDPKTWIIPGDNIRADTLEGEFLLSRKIILGSRRRRKIISERGVADVVEALIGSFLHSGGEFAALSFMEWLGIKVDFMHHPYTTHLELNPWELVNVEFLESLFNYKFQDTSLLVEALTHGSFRAPKIPRSYQRLEFLGDAVLDYVVTKYLYDEHSRLSPELLTDLRSVSVNNDHYAQSAVKVGLYKHILYSSQELERQIDTSVQDFEKSSVSCFGWESEIVYPKILADIVESVAGAIFVDSRYSTKKVFESMRPQFFEPMVTPETLKLHPVRELNELCQKQHYVLEKKCVPNNSGNIGKTVTIKVVANGVIIVNHSRSSSNEDMADRIASKDALKMLKECIFGADT